MIRLAVSNPETAIWQEAAPRLRAATIVTAVDAQHHAPPESCVAAVFAGPGRADAEAIARWLRAGKHVLLALEECLPNDLLEALFGVARETKVRLAVVNPDRYLPSRQLIRQQIDAGKLGEVVLVRSHRWETAAFDGARVPGPVVYDLELTLTLLGKGPNRVYAIDRLVNEQGDLASRYLQVHLGFPGGSMALLDYTNSLPPGDGYQMLSVIGSAGAAYADDHQNMQLLYRGGRPQALRTDERARQLTTLVQEFVDALHAGDEGNESTWRTVWAVAAAVGCSLETRQPIPLGGS
jgi:predicted dehydrogenase